MSSVGDKSPVEPSTGKSSTSIVPYTGKRSAIKQSNLYMPETLKTRMQHVMQSVMNDSFRAQFRDYDHFHHYGMGDIVVLVGTSTAGKTSIIQALKKLESDRLEDGGDIRAESISLKIMTKYNPKEVEILDKVLKKPLDIVKAVDSGERSWKTGILPQEITEAEEAIQEIKKRQDKFSSQEKEEIQGLFDNMPLEMFDEGFEHSRRGRNIIFDIMNIDLFSQHLLMRNFNGPVRTVLAYCPFHVLSSRMETRNKEAVEKGELSNLRVGAFPLTQFSKIYTQKEKGQVALERLTREQVTKTFDENFDNGTRADQEAARIAGREPPSEKELKEISEKKAKLRTEVLTNLGFKEGIDVVEISPKNQRLYKLRIDSSKLSPDDSAKKIHDGTYQRY